LLVRSSAAHIDDFCAAVKASRSPSRKRRARALAASGHAALWAEMMACASIFTDGPMVVEMATALR
jgi:hypothetical protein